MSAERVPESRAQAPLTEFPRTYARTYARVASSRSDSLEGTATATRRWTPAEIKARIAEGPAFRHPRPEEPLLSELVRRYEEISGDRVIRQGKRTWVALCYRVHGDRCLARIATRFAETGTYVNLLAEVRFQEPHDPDPPRAVEVSALDPDVVTEPDLVPGLIYGRHNEPAFDPTSTRRYDRRRSNPDAARFFEDEELGGPSHQSPTSKALSR